MLSTMRLEMVPKDAHVLQYNEPEAAAKIIRKTLRIKTAGGLKLVPLWIPADNCFLVFEPYSGAILERISNWTDHRAAYKRKLRFPDVMEETIKNSLKEGVGKPGSTDEDRLAIAEWILGQEL